jgi:Fe-S-cluster-containing dehydrogenase component/DMSO reductase anchor subunit
MVASRENFPLLAELLAEQQRLDTPVARFSAAFDSTSRSTSRLAPQLIPLSKPSPGEQYAFEVDLDSCTGCKSCVAACHSLNGLDDDETWRDVGMIVSPSRAHPFTQTVTSACHHCADPACLNGCPVLAYEKDPVTGIVVHLDDQCIGCGYCVLKCPYDVPKFSKRLGIVRKCDMCQSRLAEGEAPACAQACPTHAIRIVTVVTGNRNGETGDRSGETGDGKPETRTAKPETGNRRPESEHGAETEIRTQQHGYGEPHHHSALCSASGFRSSVSGISTVSNFQSPVSGFRSPVSSFPSPVSSFLPGAPDPSYTRPTTRYLSRRRLPSDLVAADATALCPQPAHWPLVALLMFMPMAVGCGIADKILSLPTPTLTVLGWLSGAAGLAFSVLHLGQPRRAWRIFLGLRKSWLSREAVVFGAWFPLATTYAAARLEWLPLNAGPLRALLAVTTASLGTLGLFCSVMIYADTRRVFWRFALTAPRFFGSAVVLGLASALASPGSPPALGFALVIATNLKLLFEARALDPLNGDRDELTAGRKTALLLAGSLRPVNELRIYAALLGGVVLPLMWATHALPPAFVWVALIACLTGELLERSLFFRAVDAPKMPGVPA